MCAVRILTDYSKNLYLSSISLKFKATVITNILYDMYLRINYFAVECNGVNSLACHPQPTRVTSIMNTLQIKPSLSVSSNNHTGSICSQMF